MNIASFFIDATLSLITKVMFILSFISSRFEFWSVNYTSKNGNPELNIFKNIKLLGEISSNSPNDLLGTNTYMTLESCW